MTKRAQVAARVRAHRARLRAQGMRPVQLWLPDVRSPQFVAAAHAQSAAVASSQAEADDQAFVDAISEDWDTYGGGHPSAGPVTGVRPQ